MKRISSFDYAQDGEPVEPYLANKDETGFLSIPRFTLTAIAVEEFMEIDNLEEAARHRYFSLWVGHWLKIQAGA